MNLSRNATTQFDWVLFVVVSAIAVLGIINLYSATSSHQETLGGLYLQQIYWLTLGAGVAVLVAVVDYRVLDRHAWVIYGVGLALLILVFLLGTTVRGSTRWIQVGSFALQPSEVMKVVLVVALARHFQHEVRSDGLTLRDLLVPGLLLGVPSLLILSQPDLGTALILAFIFFSVLALVRMHWGSVATVALVAVVTAPLVYTYVLKDYQRDRLLAFASPDADVLGIGWHTHQSLIAIGSGGLWGKGFLQGTQNHYKYFPDQHSDFPLAVWAEEQGFMGVLLLLGLYLVLVLWGIRIASQARDRFAAVLAIGVTAMIFWQTIVNVGMVCGLLPVVGVTLPLFSYGGSNVLTTMIGIGLLMNVSMRRFRFS